MSVDQLGQEKRSELLIFGIVYSCREVRLEWLHVVLVASTYLVMNHAIIVLDWSNHDKHMADTSGHGIGDISGITLLKDDHGDIVSDHTRTLQLAFVEWIIRKTGGNMKHDLGVVERSVVGVLATRISFGIETTSVFGPALETNAITEKIQKVLEQLAPFLVVPHVPLRLLAILGVHHTDRKAGGLLWIILLELEKTLFQLLRGDQFEFTVIQKWCQRLCNGAQQTVFLLLFALWCESRKSLKAHKLLKGGCAHQRV
mmetsp:Transcript_49308/g.123981  ORF Transcript_49308/g.123981 Transcript_49308/m.123981 type:complete len:257 (+) Transcript_49308:191-961(+)